MSSVGYLWVAYSVAVLLIVLYVVHLVRQVAGLRARLDSFEEREDR